MARTKRERLAVIDPAVAAILERQDRKAADLQQPAAERSAKAAERRKAKERLSRRVNWDMHPDIKAVVNQIAEDLNVPASQLASWLISLGLQYWEDHEIDINKVLRLSHSPRYDFQLSIHPLPEKYHQLAHKGRPYQKGKDAP